MKKITITIPEWAEKRHIYIFAGIDLLAFQEFPRDYINIKTVPCSMCGECCNAFKCEQIEIYGREQRCALGLQRPFSCSTADPMTVTDGFSDKCAIQFKKESIDG